MDIIFKIDLDSFFFKVKWIQWCGSIRTYCEFLSSVSFQGCDCTELLDWLFDKNDGIHHHEETLHHGNHPSWPFQENNVCEAIVIQMC